MKAIMRENEKMICSNSSWMGHLPIDWQMPKLLYVLREKISDGPHETPEYVDNGIPFISIDSLNDTKSINLQDCKRYITEEDYIRFSQKTRIEKDDILFSKAATIGKTAIIKDEKIMVWSPLAIIKANSNMINNNYLYHVLNCDKLIIDVSLSGSMNTQINVGMRELEHVKIPLPPFKEQQLIANYLDDRCSKIDAIIAEAKASIEEYKELKQALISSKVLCGMQPKVSKKSTNEKWLTDIPKHWRFEKGRHLFYETNVRSATGTEELLTVSQYTGITPRSQKNVTMIEAESLEDYKICEIGDIAANTMWMWAGAVGVSSYYGVISPSYNTYCQLHNDFNDSYLDYLLRTPELICEYASRSTGIRASRLRLYPAQFLSIYFPVPPKEEQIEIVEYLEQRLPKMDALISEKQSLIEDLEVYKKSLIYEIVTGKRKVVE